MKKALTMVLSLAILALIGCGGEGGGTKTYIELKPADTKVVTSNSPTFSFVINTNNTAGSTLCDSRHEKYSNMVQVKVIKIDEQTANASVVVDEGMFVPNDCHFEVHFPSLILEENVGYAWRVGELNEVENADTKWNSFVYSTISMGSEDANPHACEKNIVHDWTFTKKRSFWRTADVRKHTSALHMSVLSQGHDDNGAANLVSPNSVIFQVLSQPIVQGKYYKLKFSLKHPGKEGFKVKALAYNGQLDGLQPDANTSIIGFTGTIPNQNDWVKISLNPWKANKNFSSLAIALVNDQNQSVTAKIDRVCLVVVDGGGCGEEVDISVAIPTQFDMNSSNPVITSNEYIAGSVHDLYPNYNTSTANWFEDINDSSMECSSLGGELTDAEEEEINMEMLDPEFDMILSDLNTSPNILNNINIYDSDESNMTILELLPIINNISSDKCTNKIIDTSKPFSGRDIVYIHGLQLPALKGNLDIYKTFQEKWPVDKQKFYANGDILKKAKDYWGEHIERELGVEFNSTQVVGTPSNSFLVVSWSANQRVRYGIHAVLTQIRDAMAGSNPNVVQSKESKSENQCFGDNGIVVVTHSTGGLIASAMFGIAENSHDTSAEITKHGPTINIHDTFGDVRYITDKIDVQLGLNAAFGGSPFAEKALNAITILGPTLTSIPRANDIIEEFLQKENYVYTNSIVPILWQSSLVDLIPTVSVERWRKWQTSRIPTLTMSSAFLGKAIGSPSIGGKIITGFDDLVLSASSQTNSYVRKPRFKVKNRGKLKDKGIGPKRAKKLIKNGKKASGNGYRNYFNTPYIAPTGMLQGNSVKSIVDPINWHIPNHHLVLQTTGDHFDNVNEVKRNGNLYAYTKHTDNQWSFFPLELTRVSNDESNYEETGVVFNPALYSTGLLSSQFGNLNQEWIRNETWGFHFIKTTWVYKQIKVFGRAVGGLHVPKITWHYYEYIKWQRKYHLLKDYDTKIGADYMYDYILRP